MGSSGAMTTHSNASVHPTDESKVGRGVGVRVDVGVGLGVRVGVGVGDGVCVGVSVGIAASVRADASSV